MTDPQPIGTLLTQRLDSILAGRGINPTAPGDDEPTDREAAKAAYRDESLAWADRGIPARYNSARVTDPDIRAWVQDAITLDPTAPGGYALTATGSLLILGPTGVGKTHNGYAAIRLIAGHGIRCHWHAYSAADLYATLRPRKDHDSEDAYQQVADCPLLLIDDLGAAKGSEWTEEITYRLINHRYEHMLPTIITSNVPPGDLKVTLGDRVASRLVEMCQRVVLKGEDRRRT